MKYLIKKTFHTILIAGFMFFLLFHAGSGKEYAFLGLNTWFCQMVPSLLPFLILSGLLIQLDLISDFCKPFRFLLRPIFRMNDACLYVLITGFLFGFPMGAKNISHLYTEGKLTKSESEYLLAFCNNIGPVYFLSFVRNNAYSKSYHSYGTFLMFAVPLLYGVFLRYTFYRGKIRYSMFHPDTNPRTAEKPGEGKELSLFDTLDTSITAALVQISILGGYMILFNLLALLPACIFSDNPFQGFLHSLIELSGGLQVLKGCPFSENKKFLLVHLALSFNGLCCMSQTFHFIKDTNLSGQKYMLHKMILCSITLLCFFLFT